MACLHYQNRHLSLWIYLADECPIGKMEQFANFTIRVIFKIRNLNFILLIPKFRDF